MLRQEPMHLGHVVDKVETIPLPAKSLQTEKGMPSQAERSGRVAVHTHGHFAAKLCHPHPYQVKSSRLADVLPVFYADGMSIHAYRTVAEAVRALEQRGFTANFELIGKTFRAVESGKTFAPGDLTIVEHHRFEGASDPEELAVVYAIQAKDGTRGTLVDAYGVYANPDLSAFLKDVSIQEDRAA